MEGPGGGGQDSLTVPGAVCLACLSCSAHTPPSLSLLKCPSPDILSPASQPCFSEPVTVAYLSY